MIVVIARPGGQEGRVRGMARVQELHPCPRQLHVLSSLPHGRGGLGRGLEGSPDAQVYQEQEELVTVENLE